MASSRWSAAVAGRDGPRRQSARRIKGGGRRRHPEITEREFPFDETPDQLTAMEAIREDMQQPRPMDRLLCGDLGFHLLDASAAADMLAWENSRFSIDAFRADLAQ